MKTNKTNILNSKKKLKKLNKKYSNDITWILGLYGTAIGVGVLFLPINAGIGGIVPLIITTILAFPITYFAHRGLTRFVLSANSKNKDITEVAEEYFGVNIGKIITLLYFLSIYPILLIYSVAITNTVESTIINQFKLVPPPRSILSFILITTIMIIVNFNKRTLLKIINFLVFPFIASLILLAIYLIPRWNFSAVNFYSSSNISNINYINSFIITLWLSIPIVILSFNHLPMISSFAIAKREEYGENAEKKCSTILIRAHTIMIVTVMFFVFSCFLSLSPTDLIIAKKQNISILSYLANHFNTPIIAFASPVIAIIAIIKSFLGHYLGACEGFNGIIIKSLRDKGKNINIDKLNKINVLFVLFTTWIFSTLNPNIIEIIEILEGPIISLILFLMPMYAIQKVPSMYKYSGSISNIFVIIIGLLTLFAFLYSLFN